jgi:hypothetical protein
MDIGCTKTKLASSWLEEDMGSKGLFELFGDDLSAIWAAVINNDELPVEIPGRLYVRTSL